MASLSSASTMFNLPQIKGKKNIIVDNTRENIDPRIKTKALISKEMTLSDGSSAGFVKNTSTGVLQGGQTIVAGDLPAAYVEKAGDSMTGALTISTASGTALNVDTTASSNLVIGEATGFTSYVALGLQGSLAIGGGDVAQALFYQSAADKSLYINNRLNGDILFRINNVNAWRINGTNGYPTLVDGVELVFGTGNDAIIKWGTAQTPDSFVFGLGSDSRGLIICETADVGFDFAHALQTNPTVFIHSANQNTTQWIGLTHDATDAVISSGTGDIKLSPSGNVKFGTHAAVTTETVTGYITIKDAAGNSRKIAVVS